MAAQPCRLLSSASTTFGAFVIGAVGSVAGTVIAWLLIGHRLGPDGWKVMRRAHHTQQCNIPHNYLRLLPAHLRKTKHHQSYSILHQSKIKASGKKTLLIMASPTGDITLATVHVFKYAVYFAGCFCFVRQLHWGVCKLCSCLAVPGIGSRSVVKSSHTCYNVSLSCMASCAAL